MSGPFRQSDAVLTIAQDNERHAIEVTAANEVAGKLVDYMPEELMGMEFRELLPIKIAEMLDDYVEYEAGHNDVGDVLRKVRDFQLKNKAGKHMSLKVRIVRHQSQKHDEYMLIMQDEESQRETDAVMSALRENFAGHASVDSATGLPDRQSFEKGMDLVLLHRESISGGACVAVLELDDYDQLLSKYGISTCTKVLQDVASLCRQNLRGNDVVAQYGENRLALILVGTTREPAKMVLNRLRWLIAGLHIRNAQGVDVSSTVTVLFHEIDEQSKTEELLANFDRQFDDKPEGSTNMVAEA